MKRQLWEKVNSYHIELLDIHISAVYMETVTERQSHTILYFCWLGIIFLTSWAEVRTELKLTHIAARKHAYLLGGGIGDVLKALGEVAEPCSEDKENTWSHQLKESRLPAANLLQEKNASKHNV